MREIKLDSAAWKTWADFYAALFEALGSPHWHGTNLNALIDSMITGGINVVEGPYRIVFENTRHASDEARDALSNAADALLSAGARSATLLNGDIEILVGVPKVAGFQKS